MKQGISAAALALLMMAALPAPAPAGIVERACLVSDRRAVSPRLCSCIDRVAQDALTLADRKMMVRFFKNPDMAQKIRQSDRRSHEEFWKRYVAFSQQAAAICS